MGTAAAKQDIYSLVSHDTGTPAVLNIRKWINSVTVGREPIVVPAVFQTSLYRLTKFQDFSVAFGNYTCSSRLPRGSYDTYTTAGQIRGAADRKNMTFIIFHLTVWIEAAGKIVFNSRRINHVMQVYLHRARSNDPWSASVCDPNWSPTIQNEIAVVSERHHVELQKIGNIFLDLFNVSRRRRKVDIHRCLNVNACIVGKQGGICSTGLCAALFASQAYARLHPSERARDGDELMLLIRKATLAAMPKAEDFVRAYHDHVVDEKLLVKIMHEASPGRILRRQLTPPHRLYRR